MNEKNDSNNINGSWGSIGIFINNISLNRIVIYSTKLGFFQKEKRFLLNTFI